MSTFPHEPAMYIAGLGTADINLVLKSAAITAIFFALLSAIAALRLTNRKKK